MAYLVKISVLPIAYSASRGQVGGRVTWGVLGLDKDRRWKMKKEDCVWACGCDCACGCVWLQCETHRHNHSYLNFYFLVYQCQCSRWGSTVSSSHHNASTLLDVLRQTAVSYMASYTARALFIPARLSSLVLLSIYSPYMVEPLQNCKAISFNINYMDAWVSMATCVMYSNTYVT